MSAGEKRRCQIYLVTPSGLASAVAVEAFAEILKAALDAGPAAAVA